MRGLNERKQVIFLAKKTLSKSKIIIVWLPRWLSGRLCLPMQELWVLSLGQEVPLEEEMGTHSNILA